MKACVADNKVVLPSWAVCLPRGCRSTPAPVPVPVVCSSVAHPQACPVVGMVEYRTPPTKDKSKVGCVLPPAWHLPEDRDKEMPGLYLVAAHLVVVVVVVIVVVVVVVLSPL